MNGRDAARQYETVNCGGLSYASYRLTAILDEVLGYDPDLVIVATGHNEFLEDRSYQAVKNRARWLNWAVERGSRLRTVSLARRIVHGEGGGGRADQSWLDSEVEARLDDADGYSSYHRDERWRRNVIEEYEQSLRRMVNTCRQAGVPLIFVNLGENLRDCPPFVGAQGRARPNRFRRGRQLFDRGECLKIRILTRRSMQGGIDRRPVRPARLPDGSRLRLAGAIRRARLLPGEGLTSAPADDPAAARQAQTRGRGDGRRWSTESLAAQISPEGFPATTVSWTMSEHQPHRDRAAAGRADRSLGMVCPNHSWNDVQRRAAYRRPFSASARPWRRRRVGWEESWPAASGSSEAALWDVRGLAPWPSGSIGASTRREQFAFALYQGSHYVDRVSPTRVLSKQGATWPKSPRPAGGQPAAALRQRSGSPT